MDARRPGRGAAADRDFDSPYREYPFDDWTARGFQALDHNRDRIQGDFRVSFILPLRAEMFRKVPHLEHLIDPVRTVVEDADQCQI